MDSMATKSGDCSTDLRQVEGGIGGNVIAQNIFTGKQLSVVRSAENAATIYGGTITLLLLPQSCYKTRDLPADPERIQVDEQACKS